MPDRPPPGPELDALVAQAMGWTRFPYELPGNIGVAWCPPGKRPHVSTAQKLPAYSTTGDGMLKMLGWLRDQPDKTLNLFIAIVRQWSSGMGYAVDWWLLMVADLPHAVALALLDTVESQTQGD